MRKDGALYTDIHSHVIWGVDDGAETEEETRRMLREAAADRIGTIIATPHITPGIHPFPTQRFAEHLQAAREYIAREGLQIELYPGSEIYYTEHTPRMLREGRVPTLAGSSYVLVEFDPDAPLPFIIQALQNVSSAGFRPVLAHSERCMHIRSTDEVRTVRETGRALIQINAGTLIRKTPLLRRRFLASLFREGLADLIATDTHAFPGRETHMTQAMERLKNDYGTLLHETVLTNAKRIIGQAKPETTTNQ